MQIESAVRSVVGTILDFALPLRCPACGTIIGQKHSFCLDCWRSIRFLGDPCCDRCGLPFDYERGEDMQCGACLTSPPEFDRLRAAVAYGPTARAIALKLKYAGKPAVAGTLAAFMQRHLDGAERDSILVPVPLHRWRIWKRGYNQAALIATALARRSGLRLERELLQRTKATPSLRGLGRRERALAVRGAFKVPPSKTPEIVGRTIVLVDDVYTSGATANACAKALRRAGAARVNIICWARVVDGEAGNRSEQEFLNATH
jgi:ComF family protein